MVIPFWFKANMGVEAQMY
ncbi:hypothetical protein Golax_025663 [Gossypium laxum]|uniref:Uncharacterized protein n=1 Tax=Gossypium laxum TaxID=34288 RepID=A0A7J9AZ90_9ROSI|nr:hypothetical protein [Gossypium laxum]